MSTEVKEFAIVKAIMKVLKLDEAGKISKFIGQEIKSFKEKIEALNLNLQILELTRRQNVAKSDKNIEDAKDAVEAAYQNITMDDVANNAAMTSYSSRYWAGITGAEESLERLERSAKDATESYDKEVAGVKEQIAKYQARINKISKQ